MANVVHGLQTAAAHWMPICVQVLPKTFVLLLLLAIVWPFVRRRSAAARHLLLLCTLGILAALPLLCSTVPTWHAGAIPAQPQPVTLLAAISQQYYTSAIVTSPGEPLPGNSKRPIDREVLLSRVAYLCIALFLVWVSGTCAVLLRIAVGLTGLWWLGRRSQRMANEKALAILPAAARPLRILIAGRMPMTYGWLRPVLVLPDGFESWSEDRRRAVLLHEYAHVARLDWAAHMMSQFVCAMYWFNPLVWLLARQLSVEAEHACDDRVILTGVAPVEYAEHLVEVARMLGASHRMPASAIAMASRPIIKQRIAAVLDDHRLRRTMSTRMVIVATVCAVGAALPLAAVAPKTSDPQRPGIQIHRITPDAPATRNGPTLMLREFLVNLLDGDGHFLKVTVGLEVSRTSGRTVASLSGDVPRIRDAVLTSLTGLYQAPLLKSEPREKLKLKIKDAVNKALGDDLISQVFFTDFVSQ